MTERNDGEGQDVIEVLTAELPYQMMERIERYAKENDMDVSGVLIEALADFLRGNRIIENN